MGSRWHRFRGTVGLAIRRVIGRARTAPQRVLLSVLGVAVAVGLMIAVTSISLGLASESVVQSQSVDYWIVPEKSTVSTMSVSTEGVQIGNVHTIATELEANPSIQYTTPVLLGLVPVTDAQTGERDYVLAMGIVPGQDHRQVSGMSTMGLTPGDPYYNNGSYNGTWTGEVVLNEAAATVLNASGARTVSVDLPKRNDTFRIQNVTAGAVESGVGTAPVMLVHLSELQSITGATTGDNADQILVSTNDPSIKSTLANIDPQTTVVTKSGIGAQEASLSNLPLAIAVTALLIGVIVGVLFIATLMGLEVSASQSQLAVLGALGYDTRRRMWVIGVETIVVALLGGIVGCGLGALGTYTINTVVAPRLGLETVAQFTPLLFGYALVVAVIIGICGMIYPVLLGRNTDIVEVLSR